MIINPYVDISEIPHQQEEVKIKDILLLSKQNNYTNLFLQTVGKQLTRIEEQIYNVNENCQVVPHKLDLQPVTIKPPSEVSNFKMKSSKSDNEFIDNLLNKMKDLKLTTAPISSSQINAISGHSSSTSNNTDSDTDNPDVISPSHLLEIQNNFQDMQNINKTTYSQKPVNCMALTGPSRYYYPRPTPQDILYEEDFLHTQKSYHEKTIYEWNIDGKTEYQIFETIHHIMMYATLCKQNDNTDHQICRFLVNEFTGILKGWWDNALTAIQRTKILQYYKEELNPITSLLTRREDACYTLVQAILHHFVGPGQMNTKRSRELLQNLCCPSLTHFRWYKDVFLMKVMQRSDANSEHWKAKFIDGLPTFFAEKVRKKLRDKHDRMSIPYDQYSYGHLISVIIEEVLSLCNDIKLQQLMKKQNLSKKNMR